MKTLVYLFIALFAFDASTQTPFMVCKIGGYSDDDLKNFLFEENEYGDLVLKQDAFVQNYAVQSVRIINEGYEKCRKSYRVTTEDLEWVIDNSYIENVEMESFINSEKVEDDIIFFRDTFTGGVRIHEYDACRVAWMKDTCANLIEFVLPIKGITQKKKPAFVVEDNAPVPGGGKSPDVSEDVEPLAEAEKVAVDSIKKPTQWGELEYLKQQQDLAKQVLDSMGLFSQTGSGSTVVAINSFNTTNTYILPSSGSSSQENNDGQYVYYRDSWVPASSFTDLSWYSGPTVGFNAGVRFLWGINNYSYCPTGIPYHAYWDGNQVRSAIDPRTLKQTSEGNWEYTRSLSADEWRNSPQNTTYRGGTTGYNRDSWHPETHQRPVQHLSSGYYGSRRRT